MLDSEFIHLSGAVMAFRAACSLVVSIRKSCGRVAGAYYSSR
jgi:hypothetical protein